MCADGHELRSELEGADLKRLLKTRMSRLHAVSINIAQATTPSGNTTFYFNIVDDRGLTVSSPHQSSHRG